MAAEASALSVSVICSLSKGENWPLHARYDAGQGRFSDLILTTVRQANASVVLYGAKGQRIGPIALLRQLRLRAGRYAEQLSGSRVSNASSS